MEAILVKLAVILSGRWDLLSARVGEVRWLLPSWGPVVLGVGAVLAAILAAVCYARTTEGLTLRNRITLAGLRALALWSLLVMVSGVACSFQFSREVKPDLLVVVDDSASMGLGGAAGSRAEEVDAALAGPLGAWLDSRFRTRLVKTSIGLPGAGTNGTPQDLASALVRLANRPAGGPVERILLLSDGIQLGREPMEAAAAELAAPVFSLLAGPTNGLTDIIVQGVTVPPFVYRQDRAVAAVSIRVLGTPGDTVVRLFQVRGGTEKEIAAAPARLAGDTVVRLEFAADAAGLQSYVVKAEARPGELTAQNNTVRFLVDVREEKIKVLFVEGEPSWEYRYVKRALESDPAVQFCGLVRLPDTEWFYQGPEKREDGKPILRKPQDGFPIPADELNGFDVLILGDLERKAYDRGDGFGTIESFVQSRGAGLMTIGGFQVYGAGDFEGTRLAWLLPFDIKKEKKQQLINRFQVRLSNEGMMHPVMQLEFDPVKNEQAWSGLPWVEGGSAIRGVKPGATMLLMHPSLRSPVGPRPVLAAWQSGRGRVLSSALDGTWHWRLAGKTETDYHKRFWSMAVRWLAGDIRDRQGQGVLTLQEAVLEAGREAHVGIALRDPDGNPKLNAAVEFSMQTADGSPVLTRASPDPAVPGRYAVAWTPDRAGATKVKAVITAADGQTWSQERVYPVAESRAEYLRVVPDGAALAALSKSTGGGTASLKDFESLPVGQVADSRDVREVNLDVWHVPGLMLVLVACLSIEWFMRKRRGLA